MFKIEIRTHGKTELVDITSRVKNLVEKSTLEEGFCLLYVPHTTAAILINESYDPSVAQDILNHLDTLVPQRQDYLHREGNSDAHIKSSLVGNSRLLMIESNSLQLGSWQGIFFAEFDGPRQRTLWIAMFNTELNT